MKIVYDKWTRHLNCACGRTLAVEKEDVVEEDHGSESGGKYWPFIVTYFTCPGCQKKVFFNSEI